MSVIDLNERLRQLRGIDKLSPADTSNRDADMICKIADLVRAGRLRPTNLEFSSEDGEVDTVTLTLKGKE